MSRRVDGLLLTPADCRVIALVVSEGVKVLGQEAFTVDDLALFHAIVDVARSGAREPAVQVSERSWDDAADEPFELSTAEAAVMLDVSPRRVRKLIEAGRLPYRLVRGHYRLRRLDVESLTWKDAA